MSGLQIKAEIEELLHIVAKKENLSNYDIIFDQNAGIRGEGFLAEFFLASIYNKDTNETINLAIKKAFKDVKKREEFSMHLPYRSEVYFYSIIVPTLLNFQNEKQVQRKFVEVAKFYYGTVEEFKEALVMENLKAQGYGLWDKQKLMEEEHVRFIMKVYGKYHALSFAFKDQKNEQYKKLVNGIADFIEVVIERKSFVDLCEAICKDAYEALDPDLHSDVRKQFEKYRDHPFEEFRKIVHLKSEHDVIVHGDCWSNNMLFKYSESGKIVDMKLLHFQAVQENNVVKDLSYFFYSGASKQQFDKLDEHLKTYYDSLSTNLRELGSDPEKVYRFDQLKSDWKIFSKYGILLGLMLAKIKLMDNDEVQNIVKDKENDEDPAILSKMLNANVNQELLNERLKDILLHAYKIGIL